MDKLLIGEEMEEMCGGNKFHVFSVPINEKGEAWDLKTPGILQEDWPTYNHAMNCAKFRIKQGYRVHVAEYLAISAAK